MSILHGIHIFSGLSDKELSLIESHAVTRSFPKNAVVINEGDETDSLYIIISGAVKVFLSDEHGKEIIINNQGPGEYFGELALIDDAQRSASVMTTEKSTFSMISKNDFREVLAKNPNIALSLIKDLTQRVRALTDNVKSLALLDVYGRVAKVLLSMAKPHDNKLVVEEKLTQQDIANHVGASREMVARILKDLTIGGYITTKDRKIIINEKLPANY